MSDTTNTPNHSPLASGPFASDLITSDPTRSLRRSVYAILIAIAIGTLLGRIFAVDSVETIKLEQYRMDQIKPKLEEKLERLKQTGAAPERIRAELLRTQHALIRDARLGRPMLSANDRSRWCTLRALVEPDMRVKRQLKLDDGSVREETVWYAIDKVTTQKGWDTIDMVKHKLADDPDGPAYLYSSKPPLLPTLMAVPYWLIYNTTGYSLGTHTYAVVRTLLVVINVVPLLIMLLLICRLAEQYGTTDWGRIFVVASACFATLLTTFAVVLNNHLPGAFCALIAIYAAMRIWIDGRLHLRYFALAGSFAAMSVACELPAALFFVALGLVLLVRFPRHTLLAGAPAALLVGAGFFATQWIAHQDLKPPYAHRDEGDNWYDYTYEVNGRERDSYWNQRVGIDQGEPSRLWYLVHSTVGHHGVISLTPVWLISFLGLGIWMRRRKEHLPQNEQDHARHLRQLAWFIASISVVCFIFYMMRGQDDRNYGGMTCGFRWMFWFAPLWLIAMIPGADRLARSKWLRGVALVLLAISCISVAYPIWNPWTHPWILNWLHYLGVWTM